MQPGPQLIEEGLHGSLMLGVIPTIDGSLKEVGHKLTD
jgi:hypothetical protein